MMTLKDQPKKKTRGIRIELPLSVHKRLKYFKDERKYAGFDETLAEIAAVLIDLGLDAMDQRAKTLPQIKVDFDAEEKRKNRESGLSEYSGHRSRGTDKREPARPAGGPKKDQL